MQKDLKDLRGKLYILSLVETANAIPVLFAMYQRDETTSTDLNKMLARELGFTLSGGSLSNTMFSLSSQKLVKINGEYSGTKLLKRKYSLSPMGNKIVSALKKALQEL